MHHRVTSLDFSIFLNIGIPQDSGLSPVTFSFYIFFLNDSLHFDGFSSKNL